MSGTAECYRPPHGTTVRGKFVPYQGCGKEFVSDGSFDAHRVGEDEYTFAEGMAMDPPRENGRRCLTTEEMQELGFTQNKYDRWRAPDEERDPLLARVEL